MNRLTGLVRTRVVAVTVGVSQLAAAVLAAQVVEAGASGPDLAIPPPRFHGFVENQGQWVTDALFMADFGDLLVRAEPGAVVVQSRSDGDGGARIGVVRLLLEGAEPVAPIAGDRARGEFNYLIGRSPGQWRQHVPTFDDVVYPQTEKGVTVRLSSVGGRPALSVDLAPMSNPSDVVLRCEGANGLSVRPDGSLRIDTLLGPLVLESPIARQIGSNGEPIQVASAFRLLENQRIGFDCELRAADGALQVQFGLVWATFLGGTAGDYAVKVRALPSGRVVVVGRSASSDFPVTAGAFDTDLGGPTGADVFVTCLEPAGDALVFSTYLGGVLNDQGLACDLAPDGSIAIGGSTLSPDFPITPGAFDDGLAGNADAFAAVLSADGSSLHYSTFLGGPNPCVERIQGIAFNSSGLLVAAGGTCNSAPGFPVTTQAYDTTANGSSDGFLAWFDLSLAGVDQLVCSTFLGGSSSEQIKDLALSSIDEPIVIGESSSGNFPTTAGAYDASPGGQFISRLSADGTSLVASTRFKSLSGWGVIVDKNSILISGEANSSLPVTPGAYDITWNGGPDAFVARFDYSLSRLLASTYLGGSGTENAVAMALDESGRIVVAGVTTSEDYPTTPGAFDTEHEGLLGTTMVASLSPDLSQLVYSGLLGPSGSLASWANDVAMIGPDEVVIVGENASSGFPATPGAFDETFNGGTLATGDAYVARMLLKPSTWAVVGAGIAGSNGLPALSGTGELVGGQPVGLSLIRAKPSTPATLVIGLDLLNAPFKGGTMVPEPHVLIFGLPTSAQGTLSLNATWPNGLPSGFAFVCQFWIPDPAGPAGLAASNGLIGTTP